MKLKGSFLSFFQTIFGEDVKIGCLYELVVTTISGLYRYRIGDVVKVVRFHHRCPVIEFQYRQGQLLNMRSEKTTETMMYDALTMVFQRRSQDNLQLLDYTCAESILFDFTTGIDTEICDRTDAGKTADNRTGDNSVKPFYVVFLETSGVKLDATETEKLAQEVI